MKKAASRILALTLALSLAVPAMASTETLSSNGATMMISGVSEKLAATIDGEPGYVYQISPEVGALAIDGGTSMAHMYIIPFNREGGVFIVDTSWAMWWTGLEIGAGGVSMTPDTTELPSGRIDSEEDGIHADGMAGYIRLDMEDSPDFYFIFDEAAPKPETPAAKPVVVPTSQNLTVNGIAKNTEIYNIDGSNFFKLRDMAALLNGTGSQFSVNWDAASSTIAVTTGEAYESVGGELTTGTDKSASAVASAQKLLIDGSSVELTAYNIGGNNFFKLRELGEALNFGVDWDGATSTMVVTSK